MADGSIRNLSNDVLADALDEVAALLRAQQANPFRIHAWEEGARALRRLTTPVAALAEAEGRAGLQRLPHIGRGLAAAIDELLHTGRLAQRERLRGEVAPEDLLVTLPGLGEVLAARLHRELGIETLPQLEQAAHDGRLRALPGFGPRRVAALRELLAARLARLGQASAAAPAASGSVAPPRPSEGLLLEVDRHYREQAAAGTLPCITPRRFNPTQAAWLPVLHLTREDWHCTAMFSNTARAHELGKTHDWVVLHCERDGHELRFTVITASHGPHAGQRVVRGD